MVSRVDHEFYVFESEFYTQDSGEEVLPEPVAPEKGEVASEKNASKSPAEKVGDWRKRRLMDLW